jgi:hypothetical protein
LGADNYNPVVTQARKPAYYRTVLSEQTVTMQFAKTLKGKR